MDGVHTIMNQSATNQSTTVEHLVSVVIVTYNSEKYVVDCLNSLQMQAYQPVEIIVFDNASSDGTISLIQANFPAVKLLVSKANLGFAAANNQATCLAKGEFLAFLNPDTTVKANWLQPLIETLTADITIGAVTPQIVFAHNPSRVNSCGNTVHLSGITYCQQYNQPIDIGEPYTVSAVSGAAFVISHKLFAELGGFEERFFMYYEDTDLSLRIGCAGLSCTAVPAAIVYHAYKPTFSAQKIFYLERNRYLSLFSLINWQILLLMIPSLLLMECVSWGYVLLQGRQEVAAKWRAWVALVQLRSWIVNRRQKQGCSQANGLIPIFSSRLQAQYVTNSSRILLRSVETAAWLLAAPALRLANWVFK
jgi:GT2 family glycosyltransferase